MGFRDRMSQALVKIAKQVAPANLAPGTPGQDMDQKAPSSMTVGSTQPSPQAEESMKEQGLVTGGPFSPGRPLNQFFPNGQPPREWDYETGYNIATRPRAVESKMSFDTMKSILSSYDVARLCIERREDEIRGMNWSILPDDYTQPKENFDAQIKEVTNFFEKPDGVTPFDSWQQAYLDDVLSFDAGAIFARLNRGGKLAALDVVDGTTIAPLIDFWGHIPTPPSPAYIQYVQGIPGVWLNRDQLIYHPFRLTSRSPYGIPPVEWLILTINTDIRWQWHFLMYFTEGSVPDTFMQAPPDLSNPKQIEQWQELWDRTMTGNQAQKHKVRWIPNGANPVPAKDNKFDPDFPEFLLRKTCAAFKVTPEEIGFTTNSNRSTGQTQENIMYRASLEPLTKYLQGVYTRIIRKYFGYPLKFQFDLGEKEDRLMEAQTHKIYVEIGAEAPDEIRKNILGLDPDPNNPLGRFVMTNNGPLPIDQVGKLVPQMWVPTQYAGAYQMKGTPMVPSASVNVPPPDGAPPFGSTPDDSGEVEKSALPTEQDVLDELHRWKQNSRKRVRKGKNPRQFDSDILPDDLHDEIWNQLAYASTVEEVDRVFSGPFFW